MGVKTFRSHVDFRGEPRRANGMPHVPEIFVETIKSVEQEVGNDRNCNSSECPKEVEGDPV